MTFTACLVTLGTLIRWPYCFLYRYMRGNYIQQPFFAEEESYHEQRHIKNLAKYLRWSVL